MERKVKVVCSVVGLLGVLSATIGFVAEAIRFVGALLGFVAVVALLISQIVLTVLAGCICCIKSPQFPDSNWGVAVISFILSWLTFFMAIINFLKGVFYDNFNYNNWGVGVFAGGAILALANSAFGIVYYMTLTATGKNGGNNGSNSTNRNPTLEGIVMGQAQIPQVDEDPVFVHEDTYNRRNFP